MFTLSKFKKNYCCLTLIVIIFRVSAITTSLVQPTGKMGGSMRDKEDYQSYDSRASIPNTSYFRIAQVKPQSSSPQPPPRQKSYFRSLQSRKDPSNTIHLISQLNTSSDDQKKTDKLLFRIGLIVPKTAFSSQYKTYIQRIKDHLLQLSRHQTHHERSWPATGLGGSGGNISSSGAKSTIDGAGGASSPASCRTNNGPLARLQTPWQNLTFNKHFDIRVMDLVSLAPRTSAHDIIESMCQKLIEQNVSVIVYLENNQDQSVASTLVSQSFIQSSSVLAPQSPDEESSLMPSTDNVVPYDDHSGPHVSNILKKRPQIIAKSQHVDHHYGGFLKSSSTQAHFIMHLAHSAGIPIIAWSVTAAQAQRPKKQATLHLAPTVAHEAEAMLAIMKRYSWYSFSVVSTTLAGHEDFILALRHFMAASNGGGGFSSSTPMSIANEFESKTDATKAGSSSRVQSSSASSSSAKSSHHNNSDGDNSYSSRSFSQGPQDVSTQPSKTFKLLDVITIAAAEHIEEEIRKLTASETRVILLYSTKGEAVDILRVANRLKLTKRTYAWIVAQSVIGPNDNELAPLEFHPGLLGVYFRSNHERLLDELSRAITIIAHGLEGLIRDEEFLFEKHSFGDKSNIQLNSSKIYCDKPHGGSINKSDANTSCVEVGKDFRETHTTIVDPLPDVVATQSILTKHHRMLTAHSKCRGKLDRLSENRRDLLYEYFRKSSPWNEFDADGFLKNVELNVVNLDNEHRWRRIGCFSDGTLSIDDITWPEQAERPPSGTMEKFHLRAVFLEEPSFLNLADPDAETGSCKTNRAVRCRYKIAKHPTNASILLPNQAAANNSTQDTLKPAMNRTDSAHRHGGILQSNDASRNEDYEYKCCSGFCIDLIEKFAADLKFTYELYRVPDGFWGILNNNTWNGLIGEIVRGNADVIVSSIKINSNRQSAVDFTEPFLDTGISILVGKQTGVISKLAFLEPFDALAWIMFFCVGIPLATASIFFFELLSPNGFYSDHNVRQRMERVDTARIPMEQHKFSLCRTLWLVITILFGSAAHIDSPKGYTARFMSNIWATFGVVFLAVYTANLAAFMITREEYLELSGINDSRLAYPYHRHPPLKFGTLPGGNTHAVLSANRPKLYDYMRSYNQPTVEDGVEAVKRGQLDAFIYDSLVLDYLAGQDQECKLVNVGSWYAMTGYALAFPRNSRYYEKFNMKMLEYRKNGELDRLRRFWMQGLCKPGQTRHSKSKPLDLSQFMSAFLLLGAGILCSILVLLLEHLYTLYIRDKVVKCRRRKQFLKYLYPFSLSLAETLRFPTDNDGDHVENEYKNSIDNESKFINESPIAETEIKMQIFSKTQNTTQNFSSEASNLQMFEVDL